MKYSRFEWMALTVGSLSMAWAVLSTWRHGPSIEECIAQGLLWIVLVAAVRKGQRAGTSAAIFAMAAYLAMRAPWLARVGFSADVVGLVMIRTITYGVIGIGGGALCGRIRYLLARIDSQSNIDEATGVFHDRFIAALLTSMIGRYERYEKTFSVAMIEITLPTAITRDPELLHATLRKLGTTVRRTVRLGDDVGRLADGRFALVLPYTSKHGALACANRVQSVVQRTVEGAQVAIEVLGVAEDQQALATLCGPVANDTADPGTHAAAA